MRLFTLFLFIALGSTASAEWLKKQCVPDVNKMSGTKGLLFAAPASCGDKKLCTVYATCTMVDSDVAKQYGGLAKIPAEVLPRVSMYTSNEAMCMADGDHCPSFIDCMGDDPKFAVDIKWDETMNDLKPFIPKDAGAAK